MIVAARAHYETEEYAPHVRRTRADVVSSVCGGKFAYRTVGDAERALRSFNKRRTTAELKIYRCSSCTGYHLCHKFGGAYG